MTRLYSTHNKIREAKEQFEIMFINDALEENEYDLSSIFLFKKVEWETSGLLF